MKLQSIQYRFLEKVGVENLTSSRKVHLGGLMYKRAKHPEYLDEKRLPTRQFDKKKS